MKSPGFYELKHKLDEVYSMEPNNLGNSQMNSVYKTGVSFLKEMPFIYIVPTSILLSVLLYFVFGSLTIKLVSILQYGF